MLTTNELGGKQSTRVSTSSTLRLPYPSRYPYSHATALQSPPRAISRLSAESNSCIRIMQEGYPNGIDRKVMITKLVECDNINRAHARVKVSRAIAKGLIVEKGGVLYLP